MENIGKKLAELRKLPPKMSQAEAAKLVGVSTRTWGAFEACETSPKEEVLKKFAESRGMTLESLLGHRDENAHRRTIPIYATIHAGSLTQWIPDEPEIGRLELDVTEADAYSLLVHGSSMSPEIQEGDIIVLSPRAPFLNGKVYAVISGDSEHSLKRVRYDTSAKAYALIPSNREFPTVYIPEQQIIKLIRVMESRRDY